MVNMHHGMLPRVLFATTRNDPANGKTSRTARPRLFVHLAPNLVADLTATMLDLTMCVKLALEACLVEEGVG